VTVCPSTSDLAPIWFEWDSWEITPGAALSLARNAEALLGQPDMKVVLIGYASEAGSPEANCLLSGKRALAVFEYLKSLGVPEQQMSYRSVAVPDGGSHPAYREVCFDTETSE
jgi:outer membrane protein OmpA-like peptidoglycan-associated protein